MIPKTFTNLADDVSDLYTYPSVSMYRAAGLPKPLVEESTAFASAYAGSNGFGNDTVALIVYYSNVPLHVFPPATLPSIAPNKKNLPRSTNAIFMIRATQLTNLGQNYVTVDCSFGPYTGVYNHTYVVGYRESTKNFGEYTFNESFQSLDKGDFTEFLTGAISWLNEETGMNVPPVSATTILWKLITASTL